MEKKVYAALAEYKEKYGEPFLFDGIDYMEILVCPQCLPQYKEHKYMCKVLPQKQEIEGRSLNAEIFGIKAGLAEAGEGVIFLAHNFFYHELPWP